MEARLISDRQRWNDFVARSASCPITQSYEWGELARSIGAQALRVGVVDNGGALCAAMLVFITQVPVLHRTFLYAPRGPIINDPDSPAMTALLDFVRVQAHRHGAFLLKVEPGVAHENRCWLTALQRRGFRANPYPLHVRSEWVLDIRPDEQELLANMQAKWRYNVRLAARKGVSIRRGEGLTDLDTFYQLYQQTSQRDRFFIHSKDHYHAIMRLYGEGDRAALAGVPRSRLPAFDLCGLSTPVESQALEAPGIGKGGQTPSAKVHPGGHTPHCFERRLVAPAFSVCNDPVPFILCKFAAWSKPRSLPLCSHIEVASAVKWRLSGESGGVRQGGKGGLAVARGGKEGIGRET